MAQEYTTLGDVSARLVKLIATIGPAERLVFDPERPGENLLLNSRKIDELQNRARTLVPAAVNELLDHLDLLAQASAHDREATHREHVKRWNQCDCLIEENARLRRTCEQQEKRITELTAPESR